MKLKKWHIYRVKYRRNGIVKNYALVSPIWDVDTPHVDTSECKDGTIVPYLRFLIFIDSNGNYHKNVCMFNYPNLEYSTPSISDIIELCRQLRKDKLYRFNFRKFEIERNYENGQNLLGKAFDKVREKFRN